MTEPDYKSVLMTLLDVLAWTEEKPRAIPNTDRRADQRVLDILETVRRGAATNRSDAIRLAAEDALKHLSHHQALRAVEEAKPPRRD